jgi:hypothetical protein
MTKEERQEKQLARLLEMVQERGFIPLFTHFHKTEKRKKTTNGEKVDTSVKVLRATACVLLTGDDKLEVLSRGVTAAYAHDLPNKVVGRLWSLKRAYASAVSEKGKPPYQLQVKRIIPGFETVPTVSKGLVASGYLTETERNSISILRTRQTEKKEKVA